MLAENGLNEMCPENKSQNVTGETQIFRKYLLSDNLATYDPYDIWKTSLGIWVKNLFNTSRLLGAAPAMILTLYDQLFNNRFRNGYKKQEYPIVRALAAQILLNEYQFSKNKEFLDWSLTHLQWLKTNISDGYSGACWGLGFKWAAFKNVIYDENTPHATHTPYALEAFHRYTRITGDLQYVDLIKSCYQFYEKDLCVLYEDNDILAISYGPLKDKIVTNVAAYSLFAYTIFLQYFPDQKDYILNKIHKFYRFLCVNQHENGSWYYSQPENESFIDCFHSCFIIKNLLKAGKEVQLKGIDPIVEKGCRYIFERFIDKKHGLYKRFTLNNKLSFTKFDLYDNAEVLNIMKMTGDTESAKKLEAAINSYFIDGGKIYSAIDVLGKKRNEDTLRWAVMPYLYSLSVIK
jgi:hypothetical protein